MSIMKVGLPLLPALSVLCVTLLFAGGCSGDNPATNSGSGSGSVSGRGVEPLRIHAMLNNIVQDWEGQQVFATRFEEITGAELRITQPPHQSYSERVFLQLASTDVPDVIEVLPEYLPRLVGSGLVIPLDQLVAEGQHMDSVYPAYLETLRHPDGNLYGIPARDGGGCITYIRRDWLDNLGLSMPRTYEELENVLRAFATGDPNRSGRTDTYAYTDVAGGSNDWYNRLALGKGRVEIHYDYESERWVDGLTLPETREGLERLRRWYDLGYVDPDISTNTTFTARTKFINGQVGVFTYWANHWARNLQDRTEAADSPSARIAPMPPPVGVRYIRRVPPVLVITAASPRPELVFRHFIDGQYDRGPLQMLFTFGVEGYHWERTATGVSFKINQEDPYQAPFTKAYVPPGSSINSWELPAGLDPLVARSIAILDDHPYYEKQRWGGPAYNQYFVEIEEQLKPDIITAYLSGEQTLDQALETYRRGASQHYLQDILNELNGTESSAATPASEG